MFDLTPESAYLLGAILTDGHLAHVGYQRVVTISVIDRDFIEAVNESCQSMVGRTYSVIEVPPRGRQQRQFALRMTNKRLYEWVFQQTEGKQRVPRGVYRAPREVQEQFVAGVMDGDGWVSILWRPTVKRAEISSFVQIGLASCDPWLDDMKRLCDSMGLPSKGPSLMKRNNPNWRPIRRLNFKVKPFVQAEIPMRIRRKADRLVGLRRYSESSEAICLDLGLTTQV